MNLRFDMDFDSGAWPGPLEAAGPGTEAVAGTAWVGPLGLLDHLEAALGLLALPTQRAERVAEQAARLSGLSGFWDASAEVDPLGAASELLRWRDALVAAGWRGQAEGMPPRVAALAEATRDAQPGIPDRILAVATTLASRAPRSANAAAGSAGAPFIAAHTAARTAAHTAAHIEALELTEPAASYPAVWQAVFGELARHGARVEHVALSVAPTSGDLATSRAASGDPPLRAPLRADGTLQLLRADGPRQAAEEVASWLAAQASLEGVVVIGATPLLDVHLAQHGLPTTGAREARGGGALLEVLPLVVALGWQPADPSDAFQLLRLPRGPIPKAVAHPLARALSEWPAVGSSRWHSTLADGLARIEDPKRRETASERVEAVFNSSAGQARSRGAARSDGGRYPTAELERRLAFVDQWLTRGRAGLQARSNLAAEEAAYWLPRYDEALSQCRAFGSITAGAGIDDWTEAELHRRLEEARAGLGAERIHRAEAGLSHVASPAAIAGPARQIIWWGFDRANASRVARLPFSRAERDQLAAAGVRLPDPAAESIRIAQRWRRPLEQATEAALLVAPLRDEAGEESYPHPLWDEVGVHAGRSEGTASDLVAKTLRPLEGRAEVERLDVPLAPLPAPQRAWAVDPALLREREEESHSSIEAMLGCSLKWTLRYSGRLREPEAPDRIDSARLLGNLAHALFEAVMPGAQADAVRAEAMAEAWFDSEAPRHAAGLFLPGQEDARARVRRLLTNAAGQLAGFLAQAGLEVTASEERIVGTGLRSRLNARPDLVLGPRSLIVDAKWSGLARRRDQLAAGTASQLAFYAHLLGQQPDMRERAPGVAYFIVNDAAVLTTDPTLPAPARRVDGPSPEETWLMLERAFDEQAGRVRGGELEASGVPDAQGEAGPERNEVTGDPARLVFESGCYFCRYSGLCGRAFVEAAR